MTSATFIESRIDVLKRILSTTNPLDVDFRAACLMTYSDYLTYADKQTLAKICFKNNEFELLDEVLKEIDPSYNS
jgi:hypothetical protein